MREQNRITLVGMPGSPYSRKMLALLRYRHIPYQVKWGDPRNPPALNGRPLAPARPPLLPTFYLPGDGGDLTPVSDSTPIVRQLEREYAGRAGVPHAPALAFVNSVLEDFADEWCTKYMFHYRWSYPADIDKASSLIPLWADTAMSPRMHAQLKSAFAERQISRLPVVGSSDITAPVIEESYQRLIGLLDRHLQEYRFLLGARPASADFALYGQLTQLVGIDPTPAALALERSPRLCAWVDVLEDLSGLEPSDEDWIDIGEWPQSLIELFTEIARCYVPAMLANARAVEAGEPEWQTEVDGVTWVQQTFPYQAKCLRWLGEEYRGLDDHSRAAVDSLLDASGCSALIAPPA